MRPTTTEGRSMTRIVISALLILLLSSPAADAAAGQAEPETQTVLINGFEMALYFFSEPDTAKREDRQP
jgi:hypothetical protein